MTRTTFELLKILIKNLLSLLSFITYLYSRVRHLVFPSTAANLKDYPHPLDRLINEYLGFLTQRKFKKASLSYSQKLLDIVNNKSGKEQSQKTKKCRTLLSKLYSELKSNPILDYEILIQYKLPFSKLGVDQFLIYTKLRTETENRYLALWITRNIYGESTWKINDLYLHGSPTSLSFNIESNHRSNVDFYTVCGHLITDCTLTALFFTRLFADADHKADMHKILLDSRQCHVDFITTVESQLEELFLTLYENSIPQPMNILSSQLRRRVEEFRANYTHTIGKPTRGHSTSLYRLLAIYQLPSRSKKQTRVLIHLYVPSIQKYFSIWFNRAINQGLTWKLDDFYMHQFGHIKPLAYADRDYCMRTFRTLQTKVFYTPDLMSEQILDTLFPTMDFEI